MIRQQSLKSKWPTFEISETHVKNKGSFNEVPLKVYGDPLIQSLIDVP